MKALKKIPNVVGAEAITLWFTQLADILIVDNYFSTIRVYKPWNQIKQGSFAGTTGANDCNLFTDRNVQFRNIDHNGSIISTLVVFS